MGMKILDWMHRKLHPVTNNYSRVSHKKASAFVEDAGELTESVHKSLAAAMVANDTDASLLYHVLDSVLSIGTLGHPPPVLLPAQFSEQDESELGLPEKEVSAVAKPLPHVAPAIEMFRVKTEQAVEVFVNHSEEKIMAEVPLLKEDRERKERTTLADLLAAEVAAPVDEEASVAGATKRAITVLNFSTASPSKVRSPDMAMKKHGKKNQVYGVDSSHSSIPAKRIRRIIIRMVKKKIHPEASAPAPAEKGGGVAVMGANQLLLNHGGGGGEVA